MLQNLPGSKDLKLLFILSVFQLASKFPQPSLFIFEDSYVLIFPYFPNPEAKEQLPDPIHHFIFEGVLWPFFYC